MSPEEREQYEELQRVIAKYPQMFMRLVRVRLVDPLVDVLEATTGDGPIPPTSGSTRVYTSDISPEQIQMGLDALANVLAMHIEDPHTKSRIKVGVIKAVRCLTGLDLATAIQRLKIKIGQ